MLGKFSFSYLKLNDTCNTFNEVQNKNNFSIYCNGKIIPQDKKDHLINLEAAN